MHVCVLLVFCYRTYAGLFGPGPVYFPKNESIESRTIRYIKKTKKNAHTCTHTQTHY